MEIQVAMTKDNGDDNDNDDDDDDEPTYLDATRDDHFSPGIEPNVSFSLFRSNVHSRGTIILRGHAFGLFFSYIASSRLLLSAIISYEIE